MACGVSFKGGPGLCVALAHAEATCAILRRVRELHSQAVIRSNFTVYFFRPDRGEKDRQYRRDRQVSSRVRKNGFGRVILSAAKNPSIWNQANAEILRRLRLLRMTSAGIFPQPARRLSDQDSGKEASLQRAGVIQR